MPDPSSRAPALFRQLSIMLWVVLAVFAACNALIVVALYANDEAQLARDVVRLQAERLSREDRPASVTAPVGGDWAWEIRDGDGRVREKGGGLPLSPPAMIGNAEVIHFEALGPGVRIAGVTRVVVDGRAAFVAVTIAAPTRRIFREAIVRELFDHVALPLAPLALILLALSLWQVGRLTRPLQVAAGEADTLDPASLGARLTVPDAPLEAQTLVKAMNRALDRIEAGTRFIREFNANAAHELRTPLSIMRLAVERMPPGEPADTLRGDVAGMSRVVTQMLDLAQADSMAPVAAVRVDLATVASDMVGQMAPLAWAANRDIRLDIRDAPAAHGHAEAIGRALRNLLENALRHTAEGTTVEVTVGPEPRIVVRDHGPGLPPEHRTLAFERFWRADRTRSDGAGLGLGIVQATMQAHGGEARVEDADGGGAAFVLDFAPKPTGRSPD